jgi:hypothetical protein
MWKSPLLLLWLIALAGCEVSAASPSLQGKNHRVKPGETLFLLAEQAYGNGLEWPRIWEANQWIEPDRLRANEIIYIPERDASWGDPPSRTNFALDPGTGSFEREDGDVEAGAGDSVLSTDPGNGPPGLDVFRDLASTVSQKTFFGRPLHMVFFTLVVAFLAHAILQAILVWLAANITFVKEASFKKSMRAVFLTESLTLATLLVVAGVAIVMACVGPGAASPGSTQLFPALEGQLRSPAGIAVAAALLMGLYSTLSLRFLPQVFGMPVGRAMTVMAIAVLIPHLAGMYLIGQRTGLIR